MREIVCRVRILTLDEIEVPPIVIGDWVGLVQVDPPIVIADSGVRITLGSIDKTAIDIEAGVVRAPADHLSVIGDRVVRGVRIITLGSILGSIFGIILGILGSIGETAIEIGVGVARVQVDHRSVIADRVAEIAPFLD